MATTQLLLKDPKAKGVTRIICVLTDGRQTRIKIQSDYSVKPGQWGKKKSVSSTHPNSAEMNAHLLEFKNKILNIYLSAKAEGLIANAEYIREQLRPKKEVVNANVQFWQVWTEYLESKKHNFKERSFVKFQALENHLKGFETYSKIPLHLNLMNADIFGRLQDYFYKVPNKEKGLNTQTTAKYIELFKMFLNWAVKQKYTDNTGFQEFKAIQQPDTLKIVLTKEDIEKINKAPLAGKNYLANVRDLLILSTLTGLRYSDYTRIKAEHIKQYEDGFKTLRIRQEKTNEFVEIPLIEEAEVLINKLISGETHPVSNQRMNTYVKELCKLAEVDELFEVHKFQGKQKVTKRVPKHELITTHTGRRTFATNLMLRGVPETTVMKYTGHKDYKSFMKYVNIPKNAEMNIIKMALLGS